MEAPTEIMGMETETAIPNSHSSENIRQVIVTCLIYLSL